MLTAVIQLNLLEKLFKNASASTQKAVEDTHGWVYIIRHGADFYTSSKIKQKTGKKWTVLQVLFPNRSSAYHLMKKENSGRDLQFKEKLALAFAPRRYTSLRLAKEASGDASATPLRKALAFLFPTTHNVVTVSKQV